MKWLIDFLKKLFGSSVPVPTPMSVPPEVVLFQRDFRNSQFSWNDWYALTCKGMRALYPDYMRRVIWIKDNVVPSKEGLQLIATTGEAIKPDWESDGYYNFNWLRGRFNFCGQICSYDTNTERGFVLVPGNRIDWVVKVPPLGYLYFFAMWLYNALKGRPQQPEIDFEFFGSEADPYVIGGPSNYMRFSLHVPDGYGSTRSYSTGHTFPVDLSLDFHKYSLIWKLDCLIWLVDDTEYFRVNENIPSMPMLYIVGIQAGPEVPNGPAYTHIFTDKECGAKAIIRSIKVLKA